MRRGNRQCLHHVMPCCLTLPLQKLLDAGVTVVGKNIMDELAYSLGGDNAHYGTPVNPKCPDRLPGGSSSGTAAAVSAGEADLGLGVWVLHQGTACMDVLILHGNKLEKHKCCGWLLHY